MLTYVQRGMLGACGLRVCVEVGVSGVECLSIDAELYAAWPSRCPSPGAVA